MVFFSFSQSELITVPEQKATQKKKNNQRLKDSIALTHIQKKGGTLILDRNPKAKLIKCLLQMFDGKLNGLFLMEIEC